MHFAIDIDQTICGSNAHVVYARFHNKDLRLGLDDDMLAGIATYQEFIALLKGRGLLSYMKPWYYSRRRAIESAEVLLSFLPMPGASDGIAQLSRLGSVGYYTARPESMHAVTQQWLDCYDFLGELVSCGSIENKLITLARREVQERIYLVDDRAHTHVSRELEKFNDNPDIVYLREWLTLVAFGIDASKLPQTALCSLLALPSWKHVDSLLAQIV